MEFKHFIQFFSPEGIDTYFQYEQNLFESQL